MSKKLDEELAEAILPKGDEGDAPAVAKPAQRAPPKRPRSFGLLVTLLAMVGAVIALFMVGFQEAAVYSTPVDKLLGDKRAMAGRKVRIEGELVPGTLMKRDQPCEYRFTVHGAQPEPTLAVRYAHCAIPEGLRDMPGGGVQVTVEGTLTGQGDFEATLVMAKCTSKYDPKTHEMKGGPAAALPVD